MKTNILLSVICLCTIVAGCAPRTKCIQQCQVRQITSMDHYNYQLCADRATNRGPDGAPRVYGPLGAFAMVGSAALCDRHINPKTCYCK